MTIPAGVLVVAAAIVAGDEPAPRARLVLYWPAALRVGYTYLQQPYRADVQSPAELDALRAQVKTWSHNGWVEPGTAREVDFAKERVLAFPIYGFDGSAEVGRPRVLPSGVLQVPLVTRAGTHRGIVAIALPRTRREVWVTRRQDGDKDTAVLLRIPADPRDHCAAKVAQGRYGFFDADKYPDRLGGEWLWAANTFGKASTDGKPRGARPLDAAGKAFRGLDYHLGERFIQFVFWSRAASKLHLAVRKEHDWWRLDVREDGTPRADGQAAALFAILKTARTYLLPKGWTYQLFPLRQSTWRSGGAGTEPAKLVILKMAEELKAASMPAAELAKLGEIDFRIHRVVLLSRGVRSGPGVLQPALHVTPRGQIAGGLAGGLAQALMPGVCWAAAVVPIVSDPPTARREGAIEVQPTAIPEEPMSGICGPDRRRGIAELKSADPTEVLVACWQLGQRREGEAVNALVDLYTATPSEPIRRKVGAALVGAALEVDGLGTATNHQIRDAAADALYGITRSNYSANPAQWRLWAKAQANQEPAAPASVEELCRALRGSDPKVTLEAVRALGRMGPKARAALRDLRMMMGHPSAAVRTAAGEAIEAIERNMPKGARR